ncbi:DUF2520 domain-containing protein [Mucilaginibacter robiniae]|uniref:DUF2520 domain-containing protein n=1 Tax=Mucilaginibacter robiniae TaxID=2728022 RepID=A0A7L5E6I8_9SPHI|nr:Rossmann-like and DUF2520 domain-containing protein [Mucilaginibacter robiniae]QJD97997.1 DUF2520 domain-containing protein [Mucilaginibacter robiniae]
MKITILGAGNVATHMAAALFSAGHIIVQVYSRTPQNARLLAKQVQAEAIGNLNDVSTSTDMYLISVKDDVIEEIVAALAHHQKLIVHTSGATTLQILTTYIQQAGVFYPLQTFSKSKAIDFSQVPMCVEGANEEITALLQQLAQSITQNVYLVSSEQRKILHLSAVFACNFPNYLYYIAQQLLAQQQLSFDLLRPLILETAEKVQQQFPADVQTGPAVRKDEKTMDAHIALLNAQPDVQHLYQLLSQAIIKMGEHKHLVS